MDYRSLDIGSILNYNRDLNRSDKTLLYTKR